MLKRTWMAALLLGFATVGFVGCGGEETAPPPDTTAADAPADMPGESTVTPADDPAVTPAEEPVVTPTEEPAAP